MHISTFDFDLPEQLIALRPMRPREAAKLLYLQADGSIKDQHIADLIDIFRSGDVLIVNDTRVLPVQLKGVRLREGLEAKSETSIEATLIKSLTPLQWQAFIKPGRRVKVGDKLVFSRSGQRETLKAIVDHKDEDGLFTLSFNADEATMGQGLEAIGAMPLPPYIRAKRVEDAQDITDYQTQFATREGSVAAPTAGLHFSSDLITALTTKGVIIEPVTLHVGAGTFLPVKVEETQDHKMHAEYGQITKATADRLNAARAQGSKLIAIGTTTLRLLESACDASGIIEPFAGETSIFITPGVRVNSVDALMTNFHLPKSTLFMLVCAFSGTSVMQAAYRHAIEHNYRFFSYGDACLLPNLSRGH
jgi:S-adenosylmethionine:tRNA ribosyltransferase-isomerase